MVSKTAIPGLKKIPIQAVSLQVNPSSIKAPSMDCRPYFGISICSFAKSNIPANYQHMGMNSIGYGVPGALWAAYNSHADVVLTPDDVWLSISHGFSNHINNNAEKLRHYFVDHKGKKDLVVIVDESPEVTGKWDEVVTLFQGAVSGAVKGDTAKLLACDFSTSGEIEKIVGGISAMTAFQKYFTYKCYTLCGIRNVLMSGTLDDWLLVQKKVSELAKFECEDWVGRMSMIVQEFINTFNGKVNKSFWNQVAYIDPGHGGSGSVTTLTGWITDFFPYTVEGKPSKHCRIEPSDIPEMIFTVPFLLDDEDYYFKAGFTGLLYEGECFRPQLSYAVMKKAEGDKSKIKY